MIIDPIAERQTSSPPAVWRATVWYRFPKALARPATMKVLAVMVVLLLGIPSVTLIFRGREWSKPLAAYAIKSFGEDPFYAQVIEGLDAERKNALPERIRTLLTAVLPKLGAAGVVMSLLAGGSVLVLGVFFKRSMGGAGPDDMPAPREAVPWRGMALAFGTGMAAHVFAIVQSLNGDEGNAAMRLLNRWWSWSDTRFGWQTHVGGELLGLVGLKLIGTNNFGAHLPAAVASSLGLAAVYAWIGRWQGKVPGILTVGFICALPLWNEQTALLRGYGLLFLAGALILPPLWEILDGATGGRESRILTRLLVANFMGSMAHFFFAFLGLTAIVLLGLHALRRRSAVACAAVAWSLLGLSLPGVFYLPGLPATLSQTQGLPTLAPDVVPMRFVEEIGFGLNGTERWIVFFMVMGLTAVGLWQLKANDRRRVIILVAASVGLPLLMRPAYYYPRFFIHLLPLSFVTILPLSKIRMHGWAAAALSFGLYLMPMPWRTPPLVELQGACDAIRQLARPGETVYVERIIASAKFYQGEMAMKAIAAERGVPAGARLILSYREWPKSDPVIPGFHVVRRVPSRDMEMLVYESDGK